MIECKTRGHLAHHWRWHIYIWGLSGVRKADFLAENRSETNEEEHPMETYKAFLTISLDKFSVEDY